MILFRKVNKSVLNLLKSNCFKSSYLKFKLILLIKTDYSTETAASLLKKEPKQCVYKLFASVCIERMPIITCDMDKLEKRYSNLINELNVRKSLLSDHELRHLKDLEIANKRKLAGDQDNQEIVIETAVDYEDKCLKQLQSFSFAERKLSTDVDEKNIELKKRPNVLKTLDRVLDKKLILITYDPERSLWQLPKLEWNNKIDESLRKVILSLFVNVLNVLNQKLIFIFKK